ncbi:MAG TPA: hypothetical protein VJ725_11765 [Thermoanaerobaculia bacterium]|nr:hypothetical protein [Thermoanaerobaculia bacterium]
MIRSVLAVIAGYVVICVVVLSLSSLYPPVTFGFMMLFIAYGFVAAALGGYVTAAVAGRHHLRHAIVLAAVGVTLAVLALVFSIHQEALWYQFANMAVPTAGVLLGGWVRERQARRARALPPVSPALARK